MIILVVVVDFLIGGETVLVGVGMQVVRGCVGRLVLGAASDAVGYFKQVVEKGEQQAEEQGVPETVDMERGHKPGGEHDDESIDDEQEQPHAEDGEGKCEDDKNGSDEVVEQRYDGCGEDGCAYRVDAYTRQQICGQHGGKSHHHQLGKEAKGARVEVLVVSDGYFHGVEFVNSLMC